MAVKVGSAGPVIDSVIQYSQNAGKEKNETKIERKPEKAEKADGKKHQTSFSAGMNKLSDRIVSASERTQQQAQLLAGNANNAVEGEARKPLVPVQDAAVVTSTDGEIIENRSGLELSEEAVKITVDDVNKKLAHRGAAVEFSYHEKTGRYSFKVMDKETGQIIREVPPEKSLDMVAKMFEMVGLIVDEKL